MNAIFPILIALAVLTTVAAGLLVRPWAVGQPTQEDARDA